jgi:uncharacterized protein
MKFWKPLFLLLCLAACSSLPPQQVYVLGTPADDTPGVRDDTGRKVIEVKPVLIPDYLDSTEILLRTGSNEVKASQTGVWGERLSIGITEALAGDLARRIPAARVLSRPPVARPDIQVLADVTALQSTAGGDTVLSAHWTILRLHGDAPIQTIASAQGNFVAPAEGTGDAAIVNAITNVIDQMSARIAAGLPRNY